ncbi:Nucleoside-diphosphate-sugar epimerase [Abditibacterium utsteinense]|uniref:Nucleoside-diphosphate-sugar epimerase n=1 Tax=Abditibacterium utsteinense TaxID=1960156 RepID=A0A2S8SR16_9BACT|nr:NAD(P)-dependent oxidoreductase [Abditibacterium utsteinense]PQV63225.1 Nucleoside-diphosphate-sugar epimerase [Abditibacterium utsteinense]
MKILVTGAAGLVGGHVARELLENGHEVRALDVTHVSADLSGRVEMVYADISDRMAMLRAAHGCDSIAHLAAISNPIHGRELEIFEPNVVGTHYVLAAAEAHGIARVALASSCSIYGAPFAKNTFHFDYLPVDELHPQRAEELYAVSKAANELTAAAISRRSGMATTCLRINNVYDFGGGHQHWMKRQLQEAHNHRSADLWHYIEVRDVARAFRLALENVTSGYHTPIIVTRDLWTTHSHRELIARHYPELEPFLNSDWDFERFGFYDSRPAEELFGFVAQRLWRDVPELNQVSKNEAAL